MTKNQREFRRQVSRIRRIQRRLEKRGYTFEENIYPSVMPRRVSSVLLKRLSSIRTKDVYGMEGVEYIIPESGDIVSGRSGRAIERSKQSIRSSIALGRYETAERQIDRLSGRYGVSVVEEFEPESVQDIPGGMGFPLPPSTEPVQSPGGANGIALSEAYYSQVVENVRQEILNGALPSFAVKLFMQKFEELERRFSTVVLGQAFDEMSMTVYRYFQSYDKYKAQEFWFDDVIRHMPGLTDDEREEMIEQNHAVEPVEEY